MSNPFGLKDGWMPLGMATLVAATAFTLAALMCVAYLVQGFPDDACDREAHAFVFHRETDTFPPETICEFRDRETHEVKQITMVPWGPMRWLLPALAISIPILLLLGLVASLLNLRREVGRHEGP